MKASPEIKKLYRNLIENWNTAIEDGFKDLAADYSDQAHKLRARYEDVNPYTPSKGESQCTT